MKGSHSGWHWRELGNGEYDILWPLIRALEGRADRTLWVASLRRWVGRAQDRRGAAALRYASSPVLAGCLYDCFEEEGRQGRCLRLFRVWMVEPGLPGRVAEGLLTCARAFARQRGCLRLFLPRRALRGGALPAGLDRGLPRLALRGTGDGWLLELEHYLGEPIPPPTGNGRVR